MITKDGHWQAIETRSLNPSNFKLYFKPKTNPNLNQDILSDNKNDNPKIQDEIYKMTSIPRGFCVIINIVNFDDVDEMERNDSIESVNLIKKTFEYLNFKVKQFQDLKDYEIKSKLNELLNSEECTFHDCFVLYIHTHGREQGIITANNKIIEYHEIFNMFSNKNCSKLIEKPKIILFDCCRGENYSTDFSKTDNPLNPNDLSDLFVVYSTLNSKLVN